MLGGCCRLLGAAAVLPLAILIAAILETPVVLTLDGDEHAAPKTSAAVAPEPGAKYTSDATEPAKDTQSARMGSGSMFDRIAFAYDYTNKFMSLGLDQRWRRVMVQECLRLEQGDRALDLATGTADVSILVGEDLRRLGGSVLGLDPSSEMLRRGVAKVESSSLDGVVRLVKGDAQDLSSMRRIDAAGALSEPLPGLADGSIDKISMSFGIRNVPDRGKALREMRRVLQKASSSRVCILEFSMPSGESVLSAIARFFVVHVIPVIGRLATMGSGGDEYAYLERSILRFPLPRDFAREMGDAGLSVQTITSFAYGAVNLYAARPAL